MGAWDATPTDTAMSTTTSTGLLPPSRATFLPRPQQRSLRPASRVRLLIRPSPRAAKPALQDRDQVVQARDAQIRVLVRRQVRVYVVDEEDGGGARAEAGRHVVEGVADLRGWGERGEEVGGEEGRRGGGWERGRCGGLDRGWGEETRRGGGRYHDQATASVVQSPLRRYMQYTGRMWFCRAELARHDRAEDLSVQKGREQMVHWRTIAAPPPHRVANQFVCRSATSALPPLSSPRALLPIHLLLSPFSDPLSPLPSPSSLHPYQ